MSLTILGNDLTESGIDQPIVATGNDVAPPAPINIFAEQTGTNITLSWTAQYAADKYNVYRNGQYITTVTTTPWVDIETFADGQVYSYRMVSIDESNIPEKQFSVLSAATSVTYTEAQQGGDPIPTLVSPVNASTLTSGSLTIQVTMSASITGYRYRIGSTVGGIQYADVYDYSTTTAETVTLPRLDKPDIIPTDGQIIYINIDVKDINGNWKGYSFYCGAWNDPSSQTIFDATIYHPVAIVKNPTSTQVHQTPAAFWNHFMNPNAGDGVLAADGLDVGAAPSNIVGSGTGSGGTIANPVFVGGESEGGGSKMLGPSDKSKFYAMWCENVNNVELFDIEVGRVKNAVFQLGGVDNFSGDHSTVSCSNWKMTRVKSFDAELAGVKWLNRSDGLKQYDCETTQIVSPYAYGGEGIYVGSGNNPDNYGMNVEIHGGSIHDNNGEAIDFKRWSTGILVSKVDMFNLNLEGQGAAVFGINELDQNHLSYAPAPRMEHCRICNITSRAYNGNGIVVAVGGEFEGNIIAGVADDCFVGYADFNMSANTVLCTGNIFVPKSGKRSIDQNDQNPSGNENLANWVRDGNYVINSDRIGNEIGIDLTNLGEYFQGNNGAFHAPYYQGSDGLRLSAFRTK